MAAINVTKLSIVFLYLRIFAIKRQLTLIFYGIIAFVICQLVSGELSAIFSCRPFKKIVHSEIPGWCVDQKAHVVAQACLNMATDIFIIVAPLRTAWNLKLPTRQKLALTMVFAIGLAYVTPSSFCMRGA